MLESSSKKKPISKPLLFSLMAGILVGLAILVTQSWLATLIKQELKEEMEQACACKVDLADTNVSLFWQIAWINNPKLYISKNNQLKFKKIIAFADLTKIFNKELIIEELVFQQGKINNIGSESVLQSIINHYTNQTESKKEKTNAWRIKLEQLKFEKSVVKHELGKQTLLGKGTNVRLDLLDNKTILTPRVKYLSLIKTSNRQAISRVGNLSARVEFEKDVTNIKQLGIKFKNSLLNAVATLSAKDRSSGTIDYELASSDFRLDQYLAASLVGQAKIDSNNKGLSLKGALKNKGQISVLHESEETLAIDSFNANYQINPDGLTIQSINANAEEAKLDLKLANTIKIQNGNITGTLILTADDIQLGNYSAKDLNSKISIDGSLLQPKISLVGNFSSAQTPEIALPSMLFETVYNQEVLNLNLKHYGANESYAELVAKLKTDQQLIKIESGEFKTSQFQLGSFFKEPQSAPLDDLRLSGKGKLKGSFDSLGLTGSMNLQLESKHFAGEAALTGNAKFKNGTIAATLKNGANTVLVETNLIFDQKQKSSIYINLDEFTPAAYDPSLRCMKLGLDLRYKFLLQNFNKGDGHVGIKELAFGCDPYSVRNVKTDQLTIRKGVLLVPNLQFRSVETDIALNGKIDFKTGLDLKAEGNLYLQSLLFLFPTLDDLRGTLETKVFFHGPIESPMLQGRATLKAAELSSEEIALSAYNIEAELELSPKLIEVKHISGIFNEGDCEAQATILPFELESSYGSVKCTDVYLTPFEETFVILDGELKLDQETSANPQIDGKINIIQAELQRELSLASIVQSIASYVFTPQTETDLLVPSELPYITLNIDIEAARNLFILTNVLETELKANIGIKGSLQAPVIDGGMESLSGWFGFRDKRFDISSGNIRFAASQTEPLIDILGERLIYSPAGENIFVVLEASGPIGNPTIKLTSDSNLSEQELVTLLTTGASSPIDPDHKRLRRQRAALAFLSEDHDNQLLQILSELTSIDSLVIEPTLHTRSGLIEPAIVAEKLIMPDLRLRGTSFLTSDVASSRLSLLYSLTDKLRILGLIDTESSQNQTSFEADLAYTFLPYQATFLNISLEGNENFSRNELLNSLRLNALSRLPVSELDRVRDDFEEYYKNQGWFEAEAFVACHRGLLYCRELHISIVENKPTYISKVNLQGDPLPKPLVADDYTTINKEQLASEEFKEKTKWKLIKNLRSEGYIAARVQSNYEIDLETGKTILSVNVKRGAAVSFIFQGNQIFSASEFLETINLFSRVQAFGNNTIKILVQNIERMYRDAGYLYASINYTKSLSENAERSVYTVTINEEDQISVESVDFETTGIVNSLEINRLLENSYPLEKDKITNLKYARAEELEYYSSLITSLLNQEGYPNANVSYEIKPIEDQNLVKVVFKVVEGEELKDAWLSLAGLPTNIPIPDLPKAPYSIPKANAYIEGLVQLLRDNGYLDPAISSSIVDERFQTIALDIDLGPQTTIRKIQIEGLNVIKEQVVKDKLSLKPGSVWTLEEINENRKKLLRLGLFSRVDLLPIDNRLDETKEDLLVRIVERPLQTLEVGAGANSVLGLHLFGEATDKSYFKDGRSLSIRLDTYYDSKQADISQGVANLSFRVPEVLSTPFTYTNDLRFQKLELDTFEYDVERVLLDTSIYRSIQDTTISLAHGLQHDDLSNVAPDAIIGKFDQDDVLLSFLNINFSYDQRDNPINPQSGYLARLDARLASDLIGSDASFASISGRISSILGIGKSPFSVAHSLHLGAAWPFSNTDQIPITQRFYLGGRNSIRGFRENSLGPRGALNSVIGGDFLVAQNLELRWKMADTFSSHLFYDLGNTYLQDQSIKLSDLRDSIGIGFRYLSPIGPVGFDIGHPLDERDGEPSLRFHFSIGTNF